MIFLNSEKQRKVISLSATFLLTLLISVSCKKKETTIGKDAIDGSEYLNSVSVDTFSLVPYTVFDDSVNSSSSYYNLLGSYNDPKFGQYNAGFFTQIRLSAENPNFGNFDDIVIDSFVLGLQYAGVSKYYGDLSQQTVEVFQLTESLSLDSTYYPFSSVAYDPSNLVQNGTFDPDPISKIIIDTTSVAAQLRIYLDPQLASDLIQHAQSTPTDFASQDAFVDYFKGLYVRVNNPVQASGKGGIFYFDTKAALSKLTIYYHLGTDAKRFDFLINSNCADFNKINRVVSGNVQQLLDDKTKGMKEFYAQAHGLKAKIEISGLANIPKKSVIHEATLELPVQYQTGYKYGIGDYLFIQRDLALGSPYQTLYSNKGYYSPSKKAFIIDIRTYVQDVASGTIDNSGIYLLPYMYNESMDRIIFNGPNTINKLKPKLTVKYTVF